MKGPPTLTNWYALSQSLERVELMTVDLLPHFSAPRSDLKQQQNQQEKRVIIENTAQNVSWIDPFLFRLVLANFMGVSLGPFPDVFNL
jgi:hypothetical protein